MAAPVTVFVSDSDPASLALTRYLDGRAVTYTRRDVDADPSAQAILFGRFGRVVRPVTQVGDVMVPGFDPLQLARLLPQQAAESEPVTFGAGVRTATPEVARAAGLAAAFGVEVGPVHPGSAADLAGIVAGDVVSAIGPYTLTGGRDQFATAVAARRPGDTMVLTVSRDGTARVVDVVFPAAIRPADQGGAPPPGAVPPGNAGS
ncbi:MAG: PDZ domain-containing protein [Candidatus Dormibacteria bacterium]